MTRSSDVQYELLILQSDWTLVHSTNFHFPRLSVLRNKSGTRRGASSIQLYNVLLQVVEGGELEA